MDDAQRNHDNSQAMFESILEAGQSAIKAFILINGGAAVALLAFMGSIVANGNRTDFPIEGIADALLKFVLGTGAAGVTMAFRYVSQEFYFQDFERQLNKCPTALRFRRIGNAFKYIAIAAGITSIGLFFCGGVLSFQSFVEWSQSCVPLTNSLPCNYRR